MSDAVKFAVTGLAGVAIGVAGFAIVSSRRSRAWDTENEDPTLRGLACRGFLSRVGAQRREAIHELIELADNRSFGSSALIGWLDLPDAAIGAYSAHDFEIEIQGAAEDDGLDASDVFAVLERHGLSPSAALARRARSNEASP